MMISFALIFFHEIMGPLPFRFRVMRFEMEALCFIFLKVISLSHSTRNFRTKLSGTKRGLHRVEQHPTSDHVTQPARLEAEF